VTLCRFTPLFISSPFPLIRGRGIKGDGVDKQSLVTYLIERKGAIIGSMNAKYSTSSREWKK